MRERNLPIARRLRPGHQARRAATACAAALAAFLCASSSTETAVANGDTRTLCLLHAHTGESIEATFRVNGAYDPAVLEKLNYFLRDWRNNDVTHMDPGCSTSSGRSIAPLARRSRSGRLGLSLAGDQRHAAGALARRSRTFAAYSWQGDGYPHPGHVDGADPRDRHAAADAAASAIIKEKTSSISTSAMCVTGRA